MVNNKKAPDKRLDFKLATYVTKAEKERFQNLARRKGITESRCLKELMRIGMVFAGIEEMPDEM